MNPCPPLQSPPDQSEKQNAFCLLRNYMVRFKAKVALGGLRNERTMSELAAHFGVHPTMINQWKKAFVEEASQLFGKGHKRTQQAETEIDELYRQIGRLKVERDFLSQNLSL